MFIAVFSCIRLFWCRFLLFGTFSFYVQSVVVAVAVAVAVIILAVVHYSDNSLTYNAHCVLYALVCMDCITESVALLSFLLKTEMTKK